MAKLRDTWERIMKPMEWGALFKQGAVKAEELRILVQDQMARERLDTNQTGTQLMKFTSMEFSREAGRRGCNVAVSREGVQSSVMRGGDLALLVGKGKQLPEGSFTEGSLKVYT